ncbi:hypothetical protein BV22DRAFT_1040770 [Leucogyrophana mollusca]|uniref:Uncharacterized protein n=1 Tax=Leucogyrophana mollusca TaxID=85980 RepID=A0ACB8B1V8_9AGAM|nr:hypothetical protein BV22DRAFT_1040770 [Leucogyrophana mollusca]
MLASFIGTAALLASAVIAMPSEKRQTGLIPYPCNSTAGEAEPICGSCAEMGAQCQIFVSSPTGFWQVEQCVLAGFCYAAENSTTDMLITYVDEGQDTSDRSLQQERLSEALFYNMTGGASTMSQQNAIDAYYSALTGTYESLGGPLFAMTPKQTSDDGPYPSSSEYVIYFWSLVSAWTGYCDTREIPYNNLADYLTYAATSNYHPTC